MATYTPFLNLEKPATSERLDVLKINSNWDKIDAGVSALNSQLATNRTATISVGEVTGTYKDVQISVSNSGFQLVKGSRIEGSSGLALMGVWFNDDKIQARVRNVSGGTIATGATVVVIYC